MLRRSQLNNDSEWMSLTKVENEEDMPVEDVKTDVFYSIYPKAERYPDTLPPDYHAILSLLFSIVGICWCVRSDLSFYE